MELVRLENVCKSYHPGEIEIPVLSRISLKIEQGEFVALMGASGSGKTTLMNILGCLDTPTSGNYWIEGEKVSDLSIEQRADLRNRKLGFVFQNYNLLPRTTALDNAMLPLECAQNRIPKNEMIEKAASLLDRVHLEEQLLKEPNQMSGGEQQRVAIARALVNSPRLLLADEPTGNLDSKTSSEIMRIFEELQAEGVTIILVTHDPEVARHAGRIITIKDGKILEDIIPQRDKTLQKQDSPTPKGSEAKTKIHLKRNFLPWTLTAALNALHRNLFRSVLTTIGIIIGISAVIAMMEVGQGSRTAVEKNIASMGANGILILPGVASSGGVTMGFGSTQTLTPEDSEEIGKQCRFIVAVAPVIRARTQVIYGNRNWVPVYINGTTPSFLAVRNWENLQEGVCFTDRDVRNGSQVCLVGSTIVRELFRGYSPLGEEIRIQNVPFKVIGVLSRKGANMVGMDQDDIVVTPWTTLKYRVSGATLANVNQSIPTELNKAERINTLNQLYPGSQSLYPPTSPSELANTPQPIRFSTIDQIMAKASSPEVIPYNIQQINLLLRQRHRIQNGQEDDFSVRDMAEMMKTLASTTELIGSLLLAVAMISLIVGGVGIMNIMLVSVTERTREIGLRMAVGARPSLILQQFLVEAVVLCLVGGAMGVLVGRGTSILVSLVLHWPTEVSYTAILSAVGVAVTVGLVFGYYPARKASRLVPIEALRQE